MSSERRIVEIAPGHAVTVRRLGRPAGRAGFVLVEKSRRPPFEVEQRRWDAGTPA